MHMGLIQVGLLYSLSLLCYVLLSAVVGPLAARAGNLLTLTLGLLISGASFILLAPSDHFSFPLSLLPFLAQHERAAAISLAAVALCLMGFGHQTWTLTRSP